MVRKQDGGTSLGRAAHMAQSDPLRRDVWNFLRGEGRAALIAAAATGRVPVGAVSQALLDRFGAEALKGPITRQFIGIAVSALLAEEGYALARPGVRLNGDPLFRAGALFERPSAPRVGAEATLLERFVDALTTEELVMAAARIRLRLRDRRPEPGEADPEA